MKAGRDESSQLAVACFVLILKFALEEWCILGSEVSRFLKKCVSLQKIYQFYLSDQ